MNERKPQGDLDAEFTLVKGAVEYPAKVARILPMLRPDEFTDPVCAAIWRVMQELISSGQSITVDRVVQELKPEDIASGCPGMTVADCVQQTLSDGSGDADEAKWCALRIRTETHRRALRDAIHRCEQAVIGHQVRDIKALLEVGLQLAESYRSSELKAGRELKRLRRRLLEPRQPT